MPRNSRLTVLLAIGLAVVAAPAWSGDAAKGKVVFVKCEGCHSLDADGPQDEGPHLQGLFGRQAGAVESYQGYSKAMKSSGIVWTEETLDEYLVKPNAFIEGTTMRFRTLKDQEDRQNLIAYLREATQ